MFELLQNYPNPFNPSTTITYSLPKPANVKIRIIDILGKIVKTLDQGYQPPGRYHLIWDGKNDQVQQVPSSIYYYQINAEGFSEIRKMILLK